jgi:hypothetical protein
MVNLFPGEASACSRALCRLADFRVRDFSLVGYGAPPGSGLGVDFPEAPLDFGHRGLCRSFATSVLYPRRPQPGPAWYKRRPACGPNKMLHDPPHRNHPQVRSRRATPRSRRLFFHQNRLLLDDDKPRGRGEIRDEIILELHPILRNQRNLGREEGWRCPPPP